MEQWEDLPLQVQSKIDHYVAARDQILTRKRRVFDETVARENTHRTKFWFHHVRVILLDKEPIQALSSHVFRNARRVLALAGHLQCPFVDVSGKDRYLGGIAQCGRMLTQLDGNRIRFFSG